ncbi:MAG: ABC transporter substrate-binding protein [marine bacterium B5-7]|nr:MAG: ABC transporter substrate-binding protein [marine bacterium B5-7]
MFRTFFKTSLVAIALVAMFISNAYAADTIKIGTFLSVTGPASFLGDPEMKTLELYVDRINKAGGVLGKQIELIAYDDATDPKNAVSFVKRLIHEDKVDIIVGGTTTGNTMAVIQEVERAGIPFISLGGASVIIDPVKKWVFKTPHTDRLAVSKVYEDMKTRGISKIGLISGSGGFDKSCRKNAIDLSAAAGITIVADETHGKGDTDMTPQLTKIKNAEGLQAVLTCGFGSDEVLVAKNFAQLGIEVPLYASHGVASSSYITGAGGAAENVRLPAAAVLVAGQLPDDNPQKAIGLAYREEYKKAYNEPISTFGGHAYDGLFLAVDAIKRAGSTDPEKVLAALESTKSFVGVDGIFNMTATDHLGLDSASFQMVEIKNGDWQLLQ